MQDRFGREINYMRISITDRCNLRCKYCMPQDIETTTMDRILTFEEIQTVVETGVKLGITHYRLTGGEPLVRRGCSKLVRMIKETEGVESVAMTTNGVLLAECARELKTAGLDGLNISLDTLDAAEFERLTGKDCLDEVKTGIDAAVALKIPVKINAVNRKETDASALISYAEKKEIPVRFIEMMPIGYGSRYGGISNESLLEKLEQQYGKAEEMVVCGVPVRKIMGSYVKCQKRLKVWKTEWPRKIAGEGPAVYYHFPKLKQPVGFISAVNHRFCDACNRVRLTTEGYLKLCLCYQTGVDLREVLRAEHDRGKLAEVMEHAIFEKPGQHCFEKIEEITEEKEMVKIGG